MTSVSPEAIAEQASELARPGASDSAISALIAAAGGDRQAVEAARDQVAARLHDAVDDWSATATLSLLNRTLSQMPRRDPLDWRVRWAHHRKP
jgi:hypothetical protein